MNSSIPYFYERRSRDLIIDFTDRRIGNRRSNVRQIQPERRRLASQIREKERYPIRISAWFKTRTSEIFGLTEDIGLGGLKLLSNIALNIGTPLTLHLSFGESVCFLNIAGQVVFCNLIEKEGTTKYAIGIKLSAVRDLDQRVLTIALQTLKQNIIAQEKSALKITVSSDTLAQEVLGTAIKQSVSEVIPSTNYFSAVESVKAMQWDSAQAKELLAKSTHGILKDKRKFPRTLLRLPLQFNIEGATYKAYVEEISPSGMLVASPLALPIDTFLAVQFSINENKYLMNISGKITVVRDSSHHQNYFFRLGIRFDNLDETEQNILTMYLETLRKSPEKHGLEAQPKTSANDSYARSRSAIIFIKDNKDNKKTINQLSSRRIVITGIGAVAPSGIGREAFWKGLAEGKNCIDRISFFDPSSFPSQVAAEIRDFDAKAFIPIKEIKRMGRSAHLAVAAAQLAIADGNLTLTENIKNKIAVILGTGTSGLEYVEEEFYALRTFGVNKMRPYTGIAAFGGALSSEISRALGLTGSSITISTGCTGAVDAMGYTLNAIRNGSSDIALTGGADAPVTSGILGAFCQMGAVSTNFNHTPKRASRPFNKDRDGFVIGEGGWVFIFEELNHALRRGAKIYSEVMGYGSTCDAYHMSRPLPSGKYSIEAMKLALLDAMIHPDEVDYIGAYGNATPINDSYETMVIKNVFGQHAYKLMISSVKSMIGHAIGACGAGGVAAALLAIHEGIVHPTINYETPDPACDLDYIANIAKKKEVKVALCNTIAFGSKNSVIVLKKYE